MVDFNQGEFIAHFQLIVLFFAMNERVTETVFEPVVRRVYYEKNAFVYDAGGDRVRYAVHGSMGGGRDPV